MIKLLKVYPEIMMSLLIEKEEKISKIFYFKIYEIFSISDKKPATFIGSSTEPHKGEIFYPKLDSDEDYVENINEAEIFISGDAKWDGCVNYIYHGHDKCMTHICSISSIESIHEIFKHIYSYIKLMERDEF